MYKDDLALNNLKWFVCHETTPNLTKPNQTNHIYYFFAFSQNTLDKSMLPLSLSLALALSLSLSLSLSRSLSLSLSLSLCIYIYIYIYGG